MTTIVWFRQDLRLADNPALVAAVARGAVLPVYILDEEACGDWRMGGAQRWWLHRSLAALDGQLRALGSQLLLRVGRAAEIIDDMVATGSASAVFWNRCYEPAAIVRDREIKAALLARGIDAQSFNASLLHEPWQIANQAGKPYQVFTAYWRQCLKLPDPAGPLAAPRELAAVVQWPASESLESLRLLPEVQWHRGMEQAWSPGELAAHEGLEEFLGEHAEDYADARDQPAQDGTSRLSPHLHFGEISPRQVWHAAREYVADWRTHRFIAEVYWREFAYHLLYHFPHTPLAPLRAEFARFPWRSDQGGLQAWQRGGTGIPMVDAGMRQLWATGWMHNRVRMIVASFLVKNLLLPWQDGARWFWDTLVDADLASNTLGWQWCAGCGADAAPFFRIFNPVSQGRRFDPDGEYVRMWVPELARLPAKFLHAPWEAPPPVLQAANIELGRTYPQPLVDLKASRTRALNAFAMLRES